MKYVKKLFEESLSSRHDKRRHQYPHTWFGSKSTMPTYIDPHTEAMWKGFQLGWKVKTRYPDKETTIEPTFRFFRND